ncbi:MAG: hypothetical protein IJ429_03540 [Lachnospiraceae bacterium]|nr:hypothetical protein [Lachnospiraceae bacterium]
MKKRRRNIGWLKDLAAILIFLFLFPYFAFSFKEQKEEWSNYREEKDISLEKEIFKMTEKPVNVQILDMYENLSELPHNNHYYVVWKEEGVTLRLPVENFLVGALAASVSVDYETEVLKAQVILLRSTLMKEYVRQREEKKAEGKIPESQEEICLDREKGAYWTDSDMQNRWGEHYEELLKKCVSAVTETQGIYLQWEGKPISGYYTGMSAGKTRNGQELSGEENKSYLKQTICAENLSAADYMKEYKIDCEEVGSISDAEMNEEGYVLSIIRDGKRISGEELQEDLGLASSNFTWKTEGENYIFRTNGKGHGFGLDQYYGNVLAKKGKDYREIIDYFFADVSCHRME